MFNIGVIGTPNKDKLILPNGAIVQSWGGVVYNLLTLNHYLGSKAVIRAICAVGVDVKDSLLDLINGFPSLETSALYFAPQRQNRVILKCMTQENKEETADLSLPPIPFDHIQPHLEDLDFLLVNFTSGKDVEKDTLRQIRRSCENPIMVDVHSLTLSDPDAKGRRRPRSLHDWKEWLEGIDYVQFSWKEAASMTDENNTSIAGLVEVADWLLEHGSKGVLVTRGSEGAFYFHLDAEGILKEEIPPFPLQNVVDTTGCGDVFSAAFISHLLISENPLKAVTFAVKAAALKATFSGLGPWLVNPNPPE
jgi:adenosine kinase